jgi:hypothetical protein
MFRELAERPSRRGANVVSIDSGLGLANTTRQQRMVPVRLFYDFLVEEGVRESNPVGRGRVGERAALRAVAGECGDRVQCPVHRLSGAARLRPVRDGLRRACCHGATAPDS